MSQGRLDAFQAAFDALPLGAFTGVSGRHKYSAVRENLAGGKAQKLVAYELGRKGCISLNLYRLESGALLKPCEMPEEKAIRFVLNLTVTG